MKITKSQLREMIKEELLKEEPLAGAPSDRMEDYESDYRDPPPQDDPLQGLIKAAAFAYRVLGDWMDSPNADEETGEAVDQLHAAITAAGGRVDAGADE